MGGDLHIEQDDDEGGILGMVRFGMSNEFVAPWYTSLFWQLLVGRHSLRILSLHAYITDIL